MAQYSDDAILQAAATLVAAELQAGISKTKDVAADLPIMIRRLTSVGVAKPPPPKARGPLPVA
ncbi:hypothetical protein [Lichenicoccus sp.]|uniref:hypothetical protein n=1 Tax=Lichenicoccus sp. TaxID=2781899 RepID=UPI003D0FBF1C